MYTLNGQAKIFPYRKKQHSKYNIHKHDYILKCGKSIDHLEKKSYTNKEIKMVQNFQIFE